MIEQFPKLVELEVRFFSNLKTLNTESFKAINIIEKLTIHNREMQERNDDVFNVINNA
jgi:hypothetical protein